MIEQEFILLIMNCKKYRYKAAYQKSTWLKNLPSYLKYYHVIGDENLDNEHKFDDENNLLLVKTMDDYNSLPKKVISSYKAINETFNYKYILKTDDDQILINNKFFDMVTGLIKKGQSDIHYGGYMIDVKSHNSKYHLIHPELPENLPINATKYCTGRFYFLSSESVNYLIEKGDLIKKEYFEDYAIGYYLRDKFKKNILHIASDKFFKDIENYDITEFVNNYNNK
jgi:hypothetical protein